tara:strand:+ start:192 stop:365 length:174 start_codon:yes stop_codon:yes gene_type:complete
MKKKEDILLESIQLLQNEGKKPLKLPLWHYAVDYSLTAVFLSAYVYTIYFIIDWLWA